MALLQAGQTLGRFRIQRLLGKGGMGQVYLAQDLNRSQLVALKFLNSNLQDTQSRNSFRGEVSLLSHLSNPHLVRIYDFFEGEAAQGKKKPRPYFSMEFIDGIRLDEIPKPLTFDVALDLLVQFCQGLQYLHSRQILHRDLKPTNAFRTPDGQLKIVDFGLSAAVKMPTEPGLGTWAYLPPEAFARGYDSLSDLFSLGVLFYQILSDRLPFSRPLINLRGIERPTPLARLRPDLPNYFCDLIDRLIELHPSRRPSSAAAVLRFINHHSDRAFPILEEESVNTSLQKIPWVERKELEEILAALGTVGLAPPSPDGGASPTLHLTGPTGVGRTRLLEELKWSFQLKGGEYLGITPEDSSNWMALTWEHFGAIPPDADFSAHSRELLKNFSSRPLVMAFEDLHAWPEQDLNSLEQFLRLASGRPLKWGFLLEWNGDAAWPAGKRLLEFTLGRADARHWTLKDLSEKESLEMIELATLEAPLAEAMKEKIQAASGGRPLLIAESLRHAWRGKGEIAAVPKNLQQMAQSRTQALSPAAQWLLALLVAHPHPVRWASAHAINAEKIPNLEMARLELDVQGITQIRFAGEPEMNLAHPSLRDSYRSGLPPALLTEAHRGWIQFLASAADVSADPATRTLQLAEHAWRAKALPETERWGPEAAQHYLNRGELQEALEWYARLLSLATVPNTRAFYQAHRAPLLYRLGRYPEAIAAYDAWIAETTDDGTGIQRIKHCLFSGQTLLAAGQDSEGVELLTRCLKTGDPQKHPHHRFYHARAHLLLSSLLEKGGEIAKTRAHLEQALKLAKDNPAVLAEAHQRLGALEQNQLQLAAALEHYEQSRRLYHEIGNPQSEAIAENSIGMLYREQGKIAQADQSLKRAYTLALKGGDLRQQGAYLENLSLIQMDQAHYAETFALMEEAREILEPLGETVDRCLLKLHLAQLYILLGNWDRADRILLELGQGAELDSAPGLSIAFYQLLGERYLWGGYPEDAARLFAQAHDMAGRQGRSSDAWLATLALGRTRIRQGMSWDPEAEIAQGLQGLGAPLGKLWASAFKILAPAQAPPEAALVVLLKQIEACELPETRLELHTLLAARMAQNQEHVLAEDFTKIAELEIAEIHQYVPEELKMDFEKNRPMRKAAQAVQDLMEKKKGGLPPPPPEESPPPPQVEARLSASLTIPEMRFRQFSEIIRQILQKSQLGDILDAVMDAALELSRAERGFCLLKQDGAGGPIPGFEIKAARQFNPSALSLKDHQFSMTAVEESIRQGAFILTDNAALDPRFREKESVAQFNLKSILVIPLEVQGKVLGVFYLDHRFQPDCFNQEDVALVTRFSLLAALAIERARLVEELQRAKEKLEGQVMDQAQRIELLTGELTKVREDLRYGYEEIVGQSPTMMAVFQQLDHVTETVIPVWILGESGTGKELIARSLHFNSPRKDGPFVTENVSAIPETLLESELFGHKKGAFTHADRDRVGLFEQAHRGTLFLDEIADMSLAMQAKLLRVLQEGEIRPVGSSKKIKIDVRLVTASNRDLQEMAKDGKFRQDLFYRVNGMTIKLPPLRQRKEDLPILVNHLVQKIAREFKLKPSELTDETLHLLLRYSWPGNVRELEGVLRNALLFAKGRPLTPDLLAANEALFKEPENPSGLDIKAPALNTEEQRAERQIILDTLRRHRMDKKLVADELGISLRNLYVRMGRHGIPKKKTVLAKFLGLAV